MCTVHGNGAFWDNGHVRGVSTIQLDSEIRLLKPNGVRYLSIHFNVFSLSTLSTYYAFNLQFTF